MTIVWWHLGKPNNGNTAWVRSICVWGTLRWVRAIVLSEIRVCCPGCCSTMPRGPLNICRILILRACFPHLLMSPHSSCLQKALTSGLGLKEGHSPAASLRTSCRGWRLWSSEVICIVWAGQLQSFVWILCSVVCLFLKKLLSIFVC